MFNRRVQGRQTSQSSILDKSRAIQDNIYEKVSIMAKGGKMIRSILYTSLTQILLKQMRSNMLVSKGKIHDIR